AVSDIEGNDATTLVGASSAAGAITNSNATGRFDTAENFKSADFPAEIGEAFVVDVINTEGNYLNDGYPILYWEDPEFNLRKLYNYELASERKTYEEDIKSVFADLYADYQDALDEAERIVSTLTSDPVAEIDAAYEDLQNTIEALYNAYYKSEDVVLPWNGANTINGVAVAEDATAEPKETDTDGAILIYRAEELAYIASQVNAANTYSGKVIRLAKDIDLNGLEGDKKLWTPIGGNTGAVNGFAGTFDGNCKEISDLYIDSTDKYAVGLFGYVLKGTIKNVHMINPNVKVVRTTAGAATDDNGVGALIGALAGTTVEHCFVRGGSVTSTYRAGGLIGSAVTNVSTVTNCYVQGTTVYTTDDLDSNSVYSVAGGIVGLANLANNTFNNCYSTAILKSENTGGDYTGGIIGRSAKATIVNNCFAENDNDIYGLSSIIPTVNYPSAVVADGKIKTLASTLGAEYVYDTNKNNGYPIFTCEGTDRDIIRDAYLTEMDSEREAYKDDIRNACPNEYDAYAQVLAEAKAMVEATEAATPEAQQELADRLTAAAEALKDAYDVSPFIVIPWDGNTIKEPIIDGTNYYIYTAEQLAWLSSEVIAANANVFAGCTFYLMKDIDLGGVIGDANGEHTVVPTNAWTPIGGRTAEGVGSNTPAFAGTFEGQGHIVRNMYIYETAATINVGLFGCTPAATIINELGIENAHVESVGKTVDTNYATGALVGYTNASTITNCFVRNSLVTATQTRYMGGLVGTGHTTAPKISNCYVSHTTVENKCAENQTYGPCVGGIIGYTYKNAVSIKNCYVAATLKNANTAGRYTGNIVGCMRSTFTNQVTTTQCYAANDIEGNQATALVGNSTDTIGMYPTSTFITQTAVDALGTAFAMDVNPAINNNFPILYWEDPEYNLRNLYNAELASERSTDEDLIAVITELYPELVAQYATAMAAAKTIVVDNPMVDNANAITAAYETLLAIKTELYETYYYSEEAILPWNGTHQVDGVDAVPKTDESGHYIIYRAEELAYVASYVNTAEAYHLSGKTVKLMKDIDLNELEWTPIGGRLSDGTQSSDRYFRGNFDGQHHKIYGLKIDTDKFQTGLFGYIEGTSSVRPQIKNVGIIEPNLKVEEDVIGNNALAPLAGHTNYTDIQHCFVRGGRVECNTQVGGLVGRAPNSTFKNCYVEGTEVILSITQEMATGLGSTTYPRAGGIVGYPQQTSTYTNVYSTAVVTAPNVGDSYTAGIIGMCHSTGITLTNCYTVGETLILPTNTSAPTVTNSAVLDAETMKKYASVLGSEFTSDYGSENNAYINNGYPIFRCEEDEAMLIDAYFEELKSERIPYAEMISKACPTEWSQYQNAMSAIVTLLDDDRISDEAEMTAAIETLNTAINDVLYPAYYKSKDVVIPWNGTTVVDGKTMAPPLVDGAYEIYRAEELAYFRDYVNGGQKMSGITVKLMKDINLNDINWTPIGGNGSTSIYFSGIFDGQHHKIYGLKIESNTFGVGLFGYIAGASATNKAYIKNFGIIEPEVSSTYANTTNGNHGVAPAVGSVLWAEVEHVFVRGGSVSAVWRAAGLVGSTISKTDANAQVVRNCYVQGTTVTSTGTNASYSSAGALVAYNNAGVTLIENCYVSNVTLSATVGTGYVGGIMGHATTADVVTVNNSYTEGYPINGTSSLATKPDVFSKQVETGEIKGYAGKLGTEYTYDLDVNINNGYPIFICEDVKADIRRLYISETTSERATYAEMIQNGVEADLWTAYQNAMINAKSVIDDKSITSKDDPSLSAAFTELTAAKEALENAYNKSKAVIIPWNGDLKFPEAVTENGVITYLIYRADELAMLAAYVNHFGSTYSGIEFKLMKDLDLNGDEHNWIPIGARDVTGTTYDSTKYFSGNFDGQGNIVRNMSAESDISLIGLFGYINGATIKNIGVEDSTVVEKAVTSSNNGSAILVGGAAGSTIEACFVRDCTVSGTNGPIAALVGLTAVAASTITDCYAQNVVLENASANKPASGIVGLNVIADTTITNCYSNATATAASGLEAGILGNATAATTILNSYSANEELYASAAATAPTVSGGSAQVEAEALKGYSTTLGSNFGDDFNGDASINAGYPILYWEDPEFEFRKYYAFELSSPRMTREDLMTKYADA
ncbi:MAG: hypothetical protein IJM97_00150, partial [Clostridia bacterium]|nr:hypothetical protein [Clostridia bacterium]